MSRAPNRDTVLSEAYEQKRALEAQQLEQDKASALRWYPEQTVKEIAARLHRDDATVAKWVGAAPQPKPEVGETWRVKGRTGSAATVEAIDKVGCGNRTVYIRLRWGSGKTESVSLRAMRSNMEKVTT